MCLCVWFVHGVWWCACCNGRAQAGLGGKCHEVVQSVPKWSGPFSLQTLVPPVSETGVAIFHRNIVESKKTTKSIISATFQNP